MFARHSTIVSLIGLGVLGLVLLSRPAAAQEAPLYTNLKPLTALLNADGTLNTATGYSGPLDARGYRMQTTATGAPRFVPVLAAADEGDENWDDRFGYPGVSFSTIHALLVDGDDVYAAGWFTEAGSLAVSNVARWDGRRWWPLGAGVEGTAYALAKYKGEIYAGGMLTKAGEVLANGIARWDGTTWQTVGEGLVGESNDPTVYALAVFNDALYVGGAFIEAGGVSAIGLARWDGTAWSAVAGGVTNQPFDGSGTVYALAASSNALYVGGDFDQAGTVVASAVAAWNGSAWSALGTGLEGEYVATVKALAVQGTKLYAGGSFNAAGGVTVRNVAVWDTGTQDWAALGSGMRGEFDEGEVSALLPVGTNVYAAGTFAFAGSVSAKNMAVWDGTAWTSLAQNGENGTSAPAHALAPGPNGSVLVAGEFEWAADLWLNRITRWDGTRFHALGEGVTSGSDYPATVYAMAVSNDGKVYIGGQFSFAGSAAAENVAMWDGTTWHGLGSGTDGIVYALTTKGDDLYVGGDFTQAGGQGTTHIARWSAAAQTWHGLGSGTNGTVYALAADANYVYAGGDFTAAGEVPAEDIARWDGAAWSKLSDKISFNPNGVIYAILPDGDFMWIGGDFLSLKVPNGYVDVNSLIGWKPSIDEVYEVSGGVTRRASSDVWGRVYALALANGALYVGGEFDKAGGEVAANAVARFDGTNWAPLGSSVGGEFTQEVRALAVDGTDVYAAGQFLSAGSATSRAIAKWNATTQAWTGLGQGLGAGDEYAIGYALAVHDDILSVGGWFYTAGGQPASAFAQWTITGTSPPPLPGIRLEPARLVFDEIALGQSAEQILTITNTSTTATLTGTVEAVAAPFSLVTGGGDFSLGAGQSHTVTVRFAPTAAGTFDETLAITHDAANMESPATVELSGTASDEAPIVTLRPFDPAGTQYLVEADGGMATNGSVFGPNRYGDRAKGMLFTLPDGATGGQVTDVRAWFAYKKSGLTDQTYTLAFYNGSAANGPTGEPFYTETYRLADIQADDSPETTSGPTVYALDTPVAVGSSFFVVFDFGAYTEADVANVALAATDALGRRVPEVWETWADGSWHNVSDAWQGDEGTAGTGRNGWYPWIEVTVATGTGTPTEPPAEHALAVELAQNAPNPFQSSTVIPFTLSRTGRVTLKVYDVLGREVSTLVDATLSAGTYAVPFDGANLSSGTYFYMLQTDMASRTRQMVVVR